MHAAIQHGLHQVLHISSKSEKAFRHSTPMKYQSYFIHPTRAGFKSEYRLTLLLYSSVYCNETLASFTIWSLTASFCHERSERSHFSSKRSLKYKVNFALSFKGFTRSQ